MEIALLDTHALRLKGKTATLLTDPTSKMPKTPADAVLQMTTNALELSKVEGSRLTISGPGEYEIGGIKITSVGGRNEIAYEVRVDGLEALFTDSQSLPKLQDKTKEYQVVVLDAVSPVDQSTLTSHTPRVVLLYGEKAKESAKVLDSETVTSLSKFQTTLEKLPEEMQVIVLE